MVDGRLQRVHWPFRRVRVRVPDRPPREPEVFAPLLCAWGLGLGGVLTQWQAALLAVAVWAVSLALAVLLERSGRPGPAESLLRAVSGRGGTSTRSPRAT
ncbi:MAG: DUF418 domain-containing protein [Nocardiopsis sp. BM-2018]|nr:MAG: DUF418 domain-containing protein [Nocardiopsis sp. BM-2018]